MRILYLAALLDYHNRFTWLMQMSFFFYTFVPNNLS